MMEKENRVEEGINNRTSGSNSFHVEFSWYLKESTQEAVTREKGGLFQCSQRVSPDKPAARTPKNVFRIFGPKHFQVSFESILCNCESNDD